jgi:L-rhamnose mutarotase
MQVYDEAHRCVPVEWLALLKEAENCSYWIFPRNLDVFWGTIHPHPVNQHWQERMSSLFEPLANLTPGERFPMMREVFYLE